MPQTSQRLIDAVEAGDVEEVEALCEEGEIDIDEREHEGGDTALLIACRKGCSSIVRVLLEYDANLKLTDDFGSTPFQIACGEGHVRIVRTFLRAGVDANEQARPGQDAPLHYANSPEVVQCLLQYGADVTRRGEQGKTPLFGKTNKAALDLLLKNGADPNAESYKHVTPLHEACQMGCVPIVKLLLERGAKANAMDSLERGPMHYASRWGDILAMVKILKQHGACVTWMDMRGRTPLHEACLGNHCDVAKWLVEQGCNPIDRDVNGMTALHFACLCDDFCADPRPLANWLIDTNHSLVHAVDSMQRTALHQCCSIPGGFLSQRPEMIMDLVKRGSFINARDCLGKTPLHLACLFNMPQHVHALLRHTWLNVDLNARDSFGWTGLHYACYKGLDDIVKILLAHGARVDIVNHKGRTPLHVMGISSSRGVHEGSEDESITRALEAPVRSEQKNDLYEKLLDLEKDIDQTGKSYSLLLSHGADATARDVHGNLPFFLAGTGCLLNEVYGMVRVAASQGLFESHRRAATPTDSRKRKRADADESHP